MKASIAEQLLTLNRRFYQSLAVPFSATRGRLQAGVMRVLDEISHEASILDLGCGNGELAMALEKRDHQGAYLGLDFSEALLEIAREKNYGNSKASFRRADLESDEWGIDIKLGRFDLVAAFATLHHIPGEELRLGLLEKVRELLETEGQFIHSNWQFLNSERLRKRIQPWDAIGLKEEDVDEGDYLLDWRRDGQGLRYVHHFNLEELAALAKKSGFELVDTFSSDGETGDLGLYQIWQEAGS